MPKSRSWIPSVILPNNRRNKREKLLTCRAQKCSREEEEHYKRTKIATIRRMTTTIIIIINSIQLQNHLIPNKQIRRMEKPNNCKNRRCIERCNLKCLSTLTISRAPYLNFLRIHNPNNFILKAVIIALPNLRVNPKTTTINFPMVPLTR